MMPVVVLNPPAENEQNERFRNLDGDSSVSKIGPSQSNGSEQRVRVRWCERSTCGTGQPLWKWCSGRGEIFECAASSDPTRQIIFDAELVEYVAPSGYIRVLGTE